MHFSFDADSTLLKVSKTIDAEMFMQMSSLTRVPLAAIEKGLTRLDIPNSGYSLKKHLLILKESEGLKQSVSELYSEVSTFLRDPFKSILYPDTADFLIDLRRSGHKTSVITFGAADYQSLKVEFSGLSDLVDHIRIVEHRGKKPEILNALSHELNIPFGQTVYTDNELYELRQMREYLGPNLGLIRIDREGKSMRHGIEHAATSNNSDKELNIKVVHQLKDIL